MFLVGGFSLLRFSFFFLFDQFSLCALPLVHSSVVFSPFHPSTSTLPFHFQVTLVFSASSSSSQYQQTHNSIHSLQLLNGLTRHLILCDCLHN